MNKKLNKAIIILLIIFFSSLFINTIGLVLMGPTILEKIQTFSEKALYYEEYEYSTNNIDKIEIKSDYSRIEIKEYENEMIKIRYVGTKSINNNIEQTPDKKLTIQSEMGKVIKIPLVNVPFLLGDFQNKFKIEVYVPAGFNGDIEVINDAGLIYLSGDFGKIDLTSDVGSIEVYGKQKELNITSDVGSVKLNGSAEMITASTNVGSVNLIIRDLTESVIIADTEVGSIDIRVPSDEQIYYNVKKDFGEFESNFKSSNDPKNALIRIEATTNVGSVEIRY